MLQPTFKLEYNKKDITKDISDYVLNINYTDVEHGQSDEVEIIFEDSQKLWQDAWIPSKGDNIRLYIGYVGEKLLNCGVFEIDEIEFSTPPDILIVKAIATSITKSLRQNNSVAYENKNLKQIANEIAKKHNLTLVGEIDDIRVERITQNKQRDLTFLKTLAEQYGYIFKITDNQLVFYKTQKLIDAKSAKIINRTECSRINLREKTSQNYKAVTVSYHNPKTGKTITANVRKLYNNERGSYVYPPDGYTMSNLVAFIPSIRVIHYNGDVDKNDSMYCNWGKEDTRIRISCYNSEQRANPQCNYLAVWRK